MLGILENIHQAAALHNLSRVDNGHGVAVFNHQAQVVGNEDHGRLQLIPQGADHVQHLGLNGNVQGGGGFVGNQQLRVAAQRDGDDHPLLHAAGELVGVVVEALRPDADHLQGFLGLLNQLCAGQLRLVDLQGLHHLLADGHHRVQGGHGVLKDHGHLLAAVFLQLVLAHGQHVLSAEANAAADNSCGGIGQ